MRLVGVAGGTFRRRNNGLLRDRSVRTWGIYVSETDIFLSYSREDRAAARHFAESFAGEGFSVWWDAALRSGETFDEVIEKELRAAKAVVVLWSPRSVASRWVRAEATLADRRNKLVPAIIEACDRPIIFELTHAADLADWTGDTSDRRWQALVSDLRRLVDAGTKDAASAQPEAAAAAKKPKAGSSASGRPWPKELDGGDGESSPTENVDALLFGPSGVSDARVRSARRTPPPADDQDQTQFSAPSDDFDLLRGDEFHCLQMIEGEGPQPRFVVSPLGLKIGRTAPADIILAGAGISRSHCMVELADNRLRVLDLNSTNGSYIDGERIDGAAFLPVGSVLRVGNRSFKHEVHSRAEVRGQADAASLNRGANLRVAGLARFS